MSKFQKGDKIRNADHEDSVIFTVVMPEPDHNGVFLAAHPDGRYQLLGERWMTKVPEKKQWLLTTEHRTPRYGEKILSDECIYGSVFGTSGHEYDVITAFEQIKVVE